MKNINSRKFSKVYTIQFNGIQLIKMYTVNSLKWLLIGFLAIGVQIINAQSFDTSNLNFNGFTGVNNACLLYTSPSPRDRQKSRMPSSA